MPRSRAGKSPRSPDGPRPLRTGDGVGPSPGLGPAMLTAMAGVIGMLALMVYLRTMARSLAPGDSPEFVTAAWVLGVPHPPGYPLFMIFGHLVEQVPIGSPSFRFGLLSALADAVVVTLVFVLLARLFSAYASPDGARLARMSVLGASAVGALALAVSTAFWAYSLVPEVFALNNLFAAMLLLVGFEWLHRPKRTSVLAAMALIFGLALAHQQTIVLLVPALAVLVFAGLRKRYDASDTPAARVRDLLRAAGICFALLLIGLLPYAYLPVAATADPPINWGDPRNIANFIADVTRSHYGSFTLTVQAQHGHVNDVLRLFGAYLLDAFTPVGLVLALVGTWWLARRRPWEGSAVGLAFIFTGPFFLALANPSLETPIFEGILQRFYILPSIPYAIAIGCGSFQFFSWVRQPLPRKLVVPITLGLGLALLAMPIILAATRFASVDRSSDRVALNYGIDVLAPLEKDALILTRGDENFGPIAYIQNVEGVRTDVVALDVELLRLSTYVDQIRRAHPEITIPFRTYDGGKKQSLNTLIAANIQDRPIYFLGNMPETAFAAGYDQEHVGLATKLVPKGAAADPRALLLLNPQLYSTLHYPDRAYPADSWETVIAARYGKVAFEAAYALQSAGRPGTEDLYRKAIRLLPDFSGSYKNLAITLQDEGRNAEAADLLEQYLARSPDDAEVDKIRTQIDALRGSSP